MTIINTQGLLITLLCESEMIYGWRKFSYRHVQNFPHWILWNPLGKLNHQTINIINNNIVSRLLILYTWIFVYFVHKKKIERTNMVWAIITKIHHCLWCSINGNAFLLLLWNSIQWKPNRCLHPFPKNCTKISMSNIFCTS